MLELIPYNGDSQNLEVKENTKNEISKQKGEAYLLIESSPENILVNKVSESLKGTGTLWQHDC